MTDLEILKELIKDSALVMTRRGSKRYSADLEEPKNERSKVTIDGIPEDSLIFRADMWPDPSSIFKGEKGECSRADFILIAFEDDESYIVYIEMKGGSETERKRIHQLKGARCLIDYCTSIAREFWESRGFLKDAKHRYVSVKTGSSRKRPTVNKSECNDTPDRMLKISSGSAIRFKQLICKASC